MGLDTKALLAHLNGADVSRRIDADRPFQIELPFRMLILGSSGCGKTQFMSELVLSTQMMPCVEKIRVFAGIPNQPVYNLFQTVFNSYCNERIRNEFGVYESVLADAQGYKRRPGKKPRDYELILNLSKEAYLAKRINTIISDTRAKRVRMIRKNLASSGDPDAELKTDDELLALVSTEECNQRLHTYPCEVEVLAEVFKKDRDREDRSDVLYIFDDLSTNDNAFMKEVLKVFRTSRNANISIIFISQSQQNGEVTTNIRNNLTHLVLFPSKDYNVRTSQAREYAYLAQASKEQMGSLLEHVSQVKWTPLVVDFHPDIRDSRLGLRLGWFEPITMAALTAQKT